MTHTKIIFNVRGGLGKSILATAVIEALKKQKRDCDVIVITSYPDVFLNNPNVKETIHHNNQIGVWKKHIFGEKVEFMVQEPYETSAFLNDEKQLIKIWCEMYGINYNGEMPKMYFSNAELKYYEGIYATVKKPIFAIQTNGGMVTENAMNYNWSRDMPETLIQRVIDHYKKDYQIVHIKDKNHKFFKDTLQAIDGYRSIAYLLSVAKKRLLIDSFAQHLSVAMGVESVVLWIGTSPTVFGYETNKNIVANKFTKDYNVHHDAYQQILLTEPIQTIPYENTEDMFNFEKIKEQLKDI